MFIDSCFIGKKVKIYNGQSFFIFNITKFMVGFRFGEFILTRKILSHKKKKNKKK